MGLKKLFKSPNRHSKLHRRAGNFVSPRDVSVTSSEDSHADSPPLVPVISMSVTQQHVGSVPRTRSQQQQQQLDIFLPTQEEQQEQRPVLITPVSVQRSSSSSQQRVSPFPATSPDTASDSGGSSGALSAHTQVAGNVTNDASSLALTSLVCLSVLEQGQVGDGAGMPASSPAGIVQQGLARNLAFHLPLEKNPRRRPRRSAQQQQPQLPSSTIGKAHLMARQCLEHADIPGAICVYQALLQRQPARSDAQRADTLSKLAMLSLLSCSSDKASSAGFAADALRYSSQALKLHRENARPLHTAVSLMEVGLCLYSTNAVQKALDKWRQAMQEACMAMGYDHPHVAVLLNNIGVLHYTAQDSTGSVRALEESVNLQKSMLKAAPCNVQHALQQLATTMGNLGMAQARIVGQEDTAVSLLQDSLALYESMEDFVGVDKHVRVLTEHMERLTGGHSGGTNNTLVNMKPRATKEGPSLFDQCEAAPPEQQSGAQSTALEVSDNQDFLVLGPLGPESTPAQQVREAVLEWFGGGAGQLSIPLTANGEDAETHRQVVAYLEQDEIEFALQLLQGLLKRRREVYGDLHPQVGSTLHIIGMVNLFVKQYPAAHTCFVEAIRIRSAVDGPGHPDVIASKMKIGMIFLATGKYEKARKAFRDIRETFLESSGYGHPQFAKIMNNIGVVLYHSRDYGGALRSFELAYEYQRQRHEDGLGGSEVADLGIANSLCNRGFVFAKQRSGDEAVEFYEQALEIRNRHLHGNDPKIRQTKKNLKQVSGSTGRGSSIAWDDDFDDASSCQSTQASAMCMADLFGAAFER